jgi:hypothetical protein
VSDTVDGLAAARDVSIVWAGEGKDFLVEWGAKGYWGIRRFLFLVEWVDGCWEVAKAMLDPAR